MTSHPDPLAHLPSGEELASLPPDGGPRYNRLVFESSPYLLQHAANPVDWWPWGPEAFAEAARLDRPVFLSVGYATCHWCHVMEHESFEDAEVAALMNATFVNIKVDREERPDIDSVYMTVTQALSGQGGWPMTVLLTPGRKPFFAGTYFPKHSRYGRPGMMDLAARIASLWAEDRPRLTEAADSVVEQLARLGSPPPGEEPGRQHLDEAWRGLRDRFDTLCGGFGGRPKFPVPHNLLFLLRRGGEDALSMVEKTLRHMRHGGIFDHVGFGFHRYSTDEAWLLPHFEKMLYDQALLTLAYTEAYQATGREEHRRTAEEVLTYVLRDLTDPSGGFHSAEDADSEGHEGKFYVWTQQEVLDILGPQEGALFFRIYGFEEDGNFYEEATHVKTGANIPHLRRPLEKLAGAEGLEPSDLRARMEEARARLFAEREKRVRPLKDDKVLADWNGLMIAALARAGAAFGDPGYTEAATRAAEFILREMTGGDGRLLKRWRRGNAGLPAHLEDYAFVAWGFLELHAATLECRWLEEAVRLVEILLADFRDETGGGFFQVAHSGEEHIIRHKDFYDGAIPSGNSAAAMVLLRLGRLTGRAEWEELARETFRAAAPRLEMGAANFTLLLCALDFAVGETTEIVLTGARDHPQFRAMKREVDRRHLPRTVVVHRPTGGEEAVLRLAPWLAGYTPGPDGAPAAHVCRNFSCRAPVTSAQALADILDGAEAAPHR